MASGSSANVGGEVQDTLQDHLKEQVSASVKEALEKTTSILSNLHRVQSFLHLIQTVSSAHSINVIKSAMEHVRAVRNDTTTLLQTVYLAEIGFQSMQDFGSGSTSLTSLMPILGDVGDEITSSPMAINSNTEGGGDIMEGLASEFLPRPPVATNEEESPPNKKPKLGVSIATCSSCHRKFASQISSPSDSQLPPVCRSCRGVTPPLLHTTAKSTTPKQGVLVQGGSNSGRNSQLTSTPKSTTKSAKQPGSGSYGNKRSKLSPMSCKMCHASFLYRRCLFRHLRENHTGIDMNNLMQYVEVSETTTSIDANNEDPTTQHRGGSGTHLENTSSTPRPQQESTHLPLTPSSSLNVTIGSEIDPDKLDEGVVPTEIDFNDQSADQEDKTGTTLSIVGSYGNELNHDSVLSSLQTQLLAGDESGQTGLEPGTTSSPSSLTVGGGGSGAAPTKRVREGVSASLSAAESFDKGTGKYVCNMCSKSFDRPYRLQRHTQIHNPDRPRVQCHICDRSFTRIDTLENHVKCLHSEERPYKCTYESCHKSFPLQSSLMHHLKVHMGGKPYKCQECENSFGLLGEYKTHMSTQHADTKNLRCADCFKLFLSVDLLEQHRSLEHLLECEICGKTFARLGYLEAHVEIHNGTSLYNCRNCSLGFTTEYSYKQHIKIHPNYTKGKKIYPCQVCDKTFYSASKMMVHYRSADHREKSKSLGLAGGQVLHTMDEELASDVSALVDKVAKSMEGGSVVGVVEDNIIQSIVESEAFKAAAASVVGVSGEGVKED